MTMKQDIILKSFDTEIARLQYLRSAYLSVVSPKKSKPAKKAAPAKRKLSKAARERIADAQRKRWAKQKKAAK